MSTSGMKRTLLASIGSNPTATPARGTACLSGGGGSELGSEGKRFLQNPFQRILLTLVYQNPPDISGKHLNGHPNFVEMDVPVTVYTLVNGQCAFRGYPGPCVDHKPFLKQHEQSRPLPEGFLRHSSVSTGRFSPPDGFLPRPRGAQTTDPSRSERCE